MYKAQEMPSRLSEFMAAVYGIMACGLAVSGITAFLLDRYYISRMPDNIFSNPLIMTGVFIVQLALVLVLSLWINRMSIPVAGIMFFLYAISLGVTLSGVFSIYMEASIFQTFAVTAGMFGFMALYGLVTHADLTSIGHFSMMGLIGLIIAMIVNLVLRNPMFDILIAGAGVVLFTILTAYDSQRIKQLGAAVIAQDKSIGQFAILGALILYLDFVNLFLFLLRFMGVRRQD